MSAPEPPYRILLDGADITGRVDAGSVSVEMREQESALMDCTIRMSSGAQDPDGHLSGTLALDIDTTGAGWVRVFSGAVIGSEPDDKAHTYKLRASTRMQEYFRSLGSVSAVVAALPGCVWNQSVFGEAPDDLWSVAQDAMSTAPIDWHILPSGDLEGVAWAAKETADHALTADDISLSSDMTRELANLDDTVNTVNLAFDYGVTRKKIREHTLSLDVLDQLDLTPCGWFRGLDEPFYAVPLPWRGEIAQTMIGGSWNVPLGVQCESPIDPSTLDAEEHWTLVDDQCAGEGYGRLRYKVTQDNYPVFSAGATGYCAFSCSVTERYEITLTASAHIAATGSTVTAARSGSHTAPAPEGWPPAAPSSPGWPTDSAGDHYQDAGDEAARTAMLTTAIAVGRTQILSGMRAGSLRCTTRIRPDITLADSVSVACWGVSTGPLKVRSVRHTLSPLRTTLELAISRGHGGTDSEIAIPGRPDTSDPVGYWQHPDRDGPGSYPVPSGITHLPVYVGSRSDADDAPSPDERVGYVCNSLNAPGFNPTLTPAKVYERAIRIEWPEVEQRASATIDVTTSISLEVAVPHDYISVTAP